jgi:hypothetical protein
MDFYRERKYKPNNMFPDCHKHVGGNSWISDLCVCFMSDGTHELLRYMMDDNDSSNDTWCTGDDIKSSVVAWMEV